MVDQQTFPTAPGLSSRKTSLHLAQNQEAFSSSPMPRRGLATAGCPVKAAPGTGVPSRLVGLGLALTCSLVLVIWRRVQRSSSRSLCSCCPSRSRYSLSICMIYNDSGGQGLVRLQNLNKSAGQEGQRKRPLAHRQGQTSMKEKAVAPK